MERIFRMAAEGIGPYTIARRLSEDKIEKPSYYQARNGIGPYKNRCNAVIYLGDSPWDGPKSLFEMLNVPDERLYRFLNDYKLNLISPADMGEGEFEKFHTDLGLAMKVIKHQKEDADEVIKETNHRKIDRDTTLICCFYISLPIIGEKATETLRRTSKRAR